MKRAFQYAAPAACVVLWTGIAQAQWSITNLHPAGASESRSYGVEGGQQVGYARIDGVDRAAQWTGTAESWMDLHPAGEWWEPGAWSSRALAVHNGHQAGSAASFDGSSFVNHASLWTGSSESWEDLHPASAFASEVHGVHNGQQVGSASFSNGTNFVTRASLWSGTAASWVSLHPGFLSGAEDSVALGVHNGQQVGWVSLFGSGNFHASLWNGTAGSWVGLNPITSSASQALGVHDGQQVGWARVGGANHASLWNGTAASWVDLNPYGAIESQALAVYDGWQVGYSRVGGLDRASLWNGTAGSWEDLSLTLPGSWGTTFAEGIWSDSTTMYIAGWGRNNLTGRDEALLWTRPIPAPSTAAALGLAAIGMRRRR